MAAELTVPGLTRLPRARRWVVENWLLIAMALLAALPVIVACAHELAAGWAATGDDAVIATRSYDVFSGRAPLVGQYSAVSAAVGEPTYSPGPLLYWLLAIPGRVAPVAMLLAVAVFNAACAAGAVVLARRRGGQVLMIAAAVAIAVMSRSLDQHVWADVWNPAAAVMPFVLLIFLSLSLACGELRLLPVVVIVASFVVQCHLGYAIPVAGLLGVALSGLWAARRRGGVTGGRGSLAAASVAAVLCWVAPVVEQLQHRPGNLTAIVHAATSRGDTLGFDRGLNELVGAVGLPPHWARDSRTTFERLADMDLDHGVVRDASAVVLILLVACVLVLALRRREHAVAAACAQALVLCGAIVAVTASVPSGNGLGLTAVYTLWWSAPAGMYAWLTAGWGLTRVVPRLGRLVEWRPMRFTAAAGVVCAVAAVGAATPGPDPLEAEYQPVRDMAAPLAAAVEGAESVRVDVSGRWTFPKNDFQTAAVYELRRRGLDVRAPLLRQNLGVAYGSTGASDAVVRIADPSRRLGAGEREIARVVVRPTGLATAPETVVVTVAR